MYKKDIPASAREFLEISGLGVYEKTLSYLTEYASKGIDDFVDNPDAEVYSKNYNLEDDPDGTNPIYLAEDPDEPKSFKQYFYDNSRPSINNQYFYKNRKR